MGFGVWGLGFGVWGLGFGVWGLGFRTESSSTADAKLTPGSSLLLPGLLLPATAGTRPEIKTPL